MKKNIFKILAAIVVCSLTMTMFTQCNREEEDDTVTDNVRLTQIYLETIHPINGNIMATTTKDFVWENGLLKSTYATMNIPDIGPISQVSEEFYYSGNKCIEKHVVSSDVDNHQYFTYTGERMTKAVEVKDGDTTQIATIHSYTDDGHVKSMTVQYIKQGSTIDFELTWGNGDLKSYTYHYVEPAGEDRIYNFSFDNYPSVHTGTPLADYIFAPDEMVGRGTKHNCLDEDCEYTYDNNRLVVRHSKTSIQYFTYSDGTTGRQ